MRQLFAFLKDHLRSAMAPAPAPTQTISSHGQLGGFTAHTVNQAIVPESGERFDKLYAVYEAAEAFRIRAFTIGLDGADIASFSTVIKQAYFLFGEEMRSYLDKEMLTKGNEIYSLDKIDAVQDRAERSRLVGRRSELTEWMRMEGAALRQRFAPLIKF